jgi:hypothetical protein
MVDEFEERWVGEVYLQAFVTSLLDEDEGAVLQPRGKSPTKETAAFCQRIDI